MRVVIQRVKKASVQVEGEILSEIGRGLVVLLGVGWDDEKKDVEWLTKKISQLRVFDDSQGVMNLSVTEVSGEIMVISQFTLQAKTKKGNRPSYVHAAPPQIAVPLYETFIRQLEEKTGKEIKTGRFGARMQISLINDGPVTIVIDTKRKE